MIILIIIDNKKEKEENPNEPKEPIIGINQTGIIKCFYNKKTINFFNILKKALKIILNSPGFCLNFPFIRKNSIDYLK